MFLFPPKLEFRIPHWNAGHHVKTATTAREEWPRASKNAQNVPTTFQLPFSYISITLVTLNLLTVFQFSDKFGSDSICNFFDISVERQRDWDAVSAILICQYTHKKK